MPIYENRAVQIHYEEAGSGFPLLVIPAVSAPRSAREGKVPSE